MNNSIELHKGGTSATDWYTSAVARAIRGYAGHGFVHRVALSCFLKIGFRMRYSSHSSSGEQPRKRWVYQSYRTVRPCFPPPPAHPKRHVLLNSLKDLT